jgi:hypothetical protein
MASVQEVAMRQTHITQITTTIGRLEEAARPTSGENIPLVFVTHGAPGLFFSIPSGFVTIVHRWGSFYHFGVAGQKFPWDYPVGYEIPYIVSQKSVDYHCPVRACPTKNNVMVEVTVTVTFQIMGSDAAKKFVYTLGAARFDDLLAAATQEAIRVLVRKHDHTEIYQLRGSKADALLSSLQTLFDRYGVQFTKATIREARLPAAVEEKRQQTAQFQSQMDEQTKRQETQINMINQEAVREMAQLERSQEMMMQDINAKKDRALITRRDSCISAETSREVAFRNAQQEVATALLRARAELKASTLEGEKTKHIMITTAQQEANATRTQVEQDVNAMVVAATADLAVVTERSKGLQVTAAAELEASTSLLAKRQNQLELERLSALADVARTRPMIISGANGDTLLSEMIKRDKL